MRVKLRRCVETDGVSAACGIHERRGAFVEFVSTPMGPFHDKRKHGEREETVNFGSTTFVRAYRAPNILIQF